MCFWDCFTNAHTQQKIIPEDQLTNDGILYINQPEPSEGDIKIVKVSINLIFSNLSPGYVKAIFEDQMSPYSSPVRYFYQEFEKVSSSRNINVDEDFIKLFMDIFSCIIDCVDVDRKIWRQYTKSYGLNNISNDNFFLLWELLSDTLNAVLLEKRDDIIINAWERVYYAILRSTPIPRKSVTFSSI